MLSRKGKRIIGILAAVVLLALGASWYRGYSRDRQKLAQALLLLQSPDHNNRYYASDLVLRHQPDNVEARLTHARESFRRGRYQVSRHDVETMPDTATADQAYEAANIGAHSLINMARNTILQAPERGLDTIGSQITEMLAEVGSYRKIIASDGRDPMTPLILRALEADTRAMYLRLVLKDIRAQINQTRTASSGEVVDALGVQTSDDQLELNMLEKEVGDLCRQSIRMDPLAQQPRVLLFKQYLRQGKLDLARQSVVMLTRRKDMTVELAIEVAGELLNLERRYYLQTTPFDIDLAQQILALVPASQTGNVEYQFVTAELLLAKGKYEAADKLLQKALSNRSYAGHTHGVCLRGRALIGLGRAKDAEQLLARLNDRNPNWETKYVQGLAAMAEHRLGLDLLRQAQEKEPGSLTVRLAICDAIIKNGGYEVADLDISQLAHFAPMHTRVMQIRLNHAVHMGQREVINEYITNVFAAGLLKVTSDDVVLLGLMVIDDVDASGSLGKTILSKRPGDPLAMLGSQMAQYPAVRRAEAARYATQALYPLVNNDPMHWPVSPKFDAWDRRLKAKALAVFGQKDAQITSQLLRGSLYLPWPHEATLRLVEVAADRWPDDMRLKQVASRLSLWLGRTDESRQWLAGMDARYQGSLDKAIAAYVTDDDVTFNRILGQLRPEETIEGTLSDAKGMHTDASDPTWHLLGVLRSLKKRDLIAARLQVEAILKVHPRAEPGLLWLVRDMLAHDETIELDAFLSRLESTSPLLSQIARSRVMLATGQLAQSTQGMSLVGVEALSDSIVRWQQTEVETIAAIAKDQPVLALGMLETLGLSIRSEAQAIGVGQVEVMIDAGRDRAAASIIMQQLSQTTIEPVYADAYLAKAMYFMEPERVLRAVDRNLAEQPGNGVWLYYRTKLLMKLGRDDQVQQAVLKLKQDYPDAPRSLMLQAQLAMDQAKLEDARDILNKMVSQGGESQRVAKIFMAQLAAAGQSTSDTTEFKR